MPDRSDNAGQSLKYVGSELDLFAQAAHWKSYWSRTVAPFLGDRVLEVGAGIGATARILCSTKQKRWLALEPDPELADRFRNDVTSGFLPSICEVRIGTLSGLRS